MLVSEGLYALNCRDFKPEVMALLARLQEPTCTPFKPLSKSITCTSLSCTVKRLWPKLCAKGLSQSLPACFSGWHDSNLTNAYQWCDSSYFSHLNEEIATNLETSKPRIQLENHHAGIMTYCNQIGCSVCCDDPETIVFSSKGVDPGALRHVPNSDGAIFWIGQNQLLNQRMWRMCWKSLNIRFRGILYSSYSWKTIERYESNCKSKLSTHYQKMNFVSCLQCRVVNDFVSMWNVFARPQSFLGWNMTQETLLKWPRSVSTSHALVSFILHNLIKRSSAPETMSGRVGWKDAQFTPRSWPSKTYFTTASEVPNTSLEPAPPTAPGAMPMATVLSRRPDVSQTRTVWSKEAETTRSSLGWKWAHIT